MRWVSDRGFAIRDKDGRITRIVGIAQDITVRKQAEERLKASEERYRTLFEESPISLWEEDFSRVKAYLDNLKASGVEDFESYFKAQHEKKARGHLKKAFDLEPKLKGAQKICEKLAVTN